ncbi:MAG TPA: WhiB family transcriptional regulator [Actinomycetota bacterium]|nr:WhiB family transcriptional regulator [Actinomycetota bacterium]
MVFLRQLNSPPAVPGVDFDPTLDRRGELDWAQRAACRGQTALFFPTHAERPGARELREAQARALCLACPVLEQCRARARQQHEYGFWGGETEEERAAAGYPVALPVGQVARRIRILREAALASAPAPIAWECPGPQPVQPGGLDTPASGAPSRNSTVRRTGPSKVRA